MDQDENRSIAGDPVADPVAVDLGLGWGGEGVHQLSGGLCVGELD
ncbi:MAG: hypothetical protein AVDCRST_MAG45-2397 [uncultured Solirubrobacterales bacterium]|uniref:Uncharacterized protein n=1 Tax=uncultured Solirubrobacterales bacterium TaxID=768556 RepID=A0A6J4TCU4_9ACTN|nr:MAG: hypothetical protein AVDCRST_MAG45-2397 [uncultured Solirubrobacterales bacterium]